MPGRSYSATASKYRYGFQNQEVDPELWGGAISFKFRVEDPRLGRFFSRDPLFRNFPWNSPYAFSENKVISAIELEGRESWSLTYGVPSDQKDAVLKSYTAAMSSMNVIHTFLDALGFVPVLGEAADGTNAIIYTAKGDYLNAAFSTISLAPLGGDLAAKGFKYSLKAAGYEGKAFKSLNAAQKWLKNAMSYGFKSADAIANRSGLKTALQKAGKVMGEATDQAHHIIPINLIEKNANVRKAIDEGFDFNGEVNGLFMSNTRHSGSHNAYDTKVNEMIDAAFSDKANAGKSAKDVLTNVVGELKTTLEKSTKKVSETFQ